MIDYLGPNGGAVNEFVFRIRNGFDEYKAGQTVHVTASGVTLAAAPALPETSLLARRGGACSECCSSATAHAADVSHSYTSDGQGRFIVRIGSSFAGPVALRIQAGDNSQSFTVNVVANLLSITTASPLPDAVNGTAYSQSFTATGGTAPYSFAVTGGALPAGLALNNGKLEGTPRADGLFTFTVTVTDSASPTAATASKEFKLTVGAAPSYTVSVAPSPASIEAWESTTFTATITKNGVAVPDGESVTWTVTGGSGRFTSGSGTSDTSRTSTTSGGSASITLQGTAASTVSEKAAFGGATDQANVTVTAATYSIRFSSVPSGAQTSNALVKATVTNSHATPVEGVSVSWSYVNKHGGTSVSLLNTTTGTDGTAGQTIPYSSGERRTVTVTATVNGTNATADVQFGAALNGYIALMSGTTDDWATANAYCQSQGGRLPSGSMPDSPITDSSLPTETVYWGNSDTTGLAHSTWLGSATISMVRNGSMWNILLSPGAADTLLSLTRVVCVPSP